MIAEMFAVAFASQVAQMQTPHPPADTGPYSTEQRHEKRLEEVEREKEHEKCQRELAGCTNIKSEHCTQVREHCVAPPERRGSPH